MRIIVICTFPNIIIPWLILKQMKSSCDLLYFQTETSDSLMIASSPLKNKLFR